MHKETDSVSDDLRQSLEEEERSLRALTLLFGADIVDQARRIDVADLNMNEKMTRAISEGVRRLKTLRGDPEAQRRWISGLEPGARLVLCMWIMDMGLLQKIGGTHDPATAGDKE